MKKLMIITMLFCAFVTATSTFAQGVHISKDGNVVTVYSNDVDSLVFFSGIEGEGISLFDVETATEEIASIKAAIEQLNAAIKSLESKHNSDKSELKADDAAEDAARKAADAEIWVALNKAIADTEQSQRDIVKAQNTADESLALAKANKKAIEAEVARAKAAEATVLESTAASSAELAKLWSMCDQLNDMSQSNARRIEEAYTELDKKIAAVKDRVAVLENKVSVLEDEVKSLKN